jgi:alkylated DNA repair protein (DNA oxidative demethylase)
MRPIGLVDPEASLVYAQTGHWHLRGFLTDAQQDAFAAAARGLKTAAPFVSPTMRDGTPLSVRVSSFGQRGWFADRQGYRYIPKHPTTGKAFPSIPEEIRAAAYQALYAASRYTRMCLPEHSSAAWGLPDGLHAHASACDTCLVNHYGPGTQLGWHVDQTELDKVSPIVTFSIGATATFEIKVDVDGEPRTFRHRLDSGDAVIMAGPSRLGEHRVTDIRAEEQADLFGPTIYNPLRATPTTRLSFTIRRTGFSK